MCNYAHYTGTAVHTRYHMHVHACNMHVHVHTCNMHSTSHRYMYLVRALVLFLWWAITSSASTTILSDTGSVSISSGVIIPEDGRGCVLLFLRRGRFDHFRELPICSVLGSLQKWVMTNTVAPCVSLNGIGCSRPRLVIPRAVWRSSTAQRSLCRNWTAGDEVNCSVVELMLLMCFQVQATLASQTKSDPMLLEWESDTSTMGIWSSVVVKILSSFEYTSDDMYTPLHEYVCVQTA